VESNEPSIKVLTRKPFPIVGRQRRCHWIDGRPFDRLLFDVLTHRHNPCDMVDVSALRHRFARLFAEHLHVDDASFDTDC